MRAANFLMTVGVLAAASSGAASADVEISSKPTANMSCGSGVCTATAAKAVLNVSDLQGMLASGDVAVKTGSLAKNIDVDQPLTWATTSRLTMDAQASVTVKKQVTVSGTGNLTIVINDGGGKKGEFVIVPEHGSVQFWDLASSLMIDGNAYTLVGDIKTLATDIATDPSGFYALARPYDASGDGMYEVAPVATDFAGVLEGLGNTISDLSINATAFQPYGFFAFIAAGGEVRDFNTKREKITANHVTAVGLLAGGNQGLISRCETNGTIQSFAGGVGGLVGVNFNIITLASSDVRIGGDMGDGGGLVGYNEAGTISASYASGTITLRNGDLTNIGGLVGENSGTIENSFARNQVKNGRKNDNTNFGGLIGRNDATGSVATSYAAGEITSMGGGVVGFDASSPGQFTSAYWDLDRGVSDPTQGAANIPNDPGITGVTDAQLKSGLPDGFNPNIWGQNPNINNGYPYLLANPPR